MTKKLFLAGIFLGMVVLALAACRRAVPVDTATPAATLTATLSPTISSMTMETPISTTRRPRPTHRPTATLHPTLTVPASLTPRPPSATPTDTTLLPIPDWKCFHENTPSPPEPSTGESNTYRLKKWAVQNALDMIREVDWANPPCIENWSGALDMIEKQNERRYTVQLALEESLSRFGNSSERELFQWRLALTNAWLGNNWSSFAFGSPQTDAWIVKTIEQALNEQQVTLDGLNGWLLPQGFQIARVQYGVDDELVYPFESQPDDIPVTLAWDQEDTTALEFVPAPNLFGDGQTVQLFVLTTRVFGGGLLIAVHQNEQAIYDLHLIHGYWNVTNGVMGNYNIGEHTKDGIPEIGVAVGSSYTSACISQTYIYQWKNDHFDELTGGGFHEWTWDCSPPAYQASENQQFDLLKIYSQERIDYYRWNGKAYEWTNVDGFIERSGELPYNLVGIIENDRISVAIEKINQAFQTGRIEEQDLWPSFPDYLRFQLALFYALQDRTDDATSEFRAIVNAPANPSIQAIPQAAQAFLNHYDGFTSIYQACNTSLGVMQKALEPYRDGEGKVNTNGMIQAWGYSESWPNFPLCNLDLVLLHLVSQLNAEQSADVPATLRQVGVAVEHSARLDIDGDGDQDWIEIVTKPPADDRSDAIVWVLMQQEQGLMALSVNAIRDSRTIDAQSAHDTFSLDTFVNPQGNQLPVIIVQSGKRLFAFQVISDGQGTHLNEVAYFLKEIADYSLETDRDLPKLTVTYLPSDTKPISEIDIWDGKENEFKVEQEMLETLAERAKDAMLQDGKAAEAIPALQAIVAYPPEPCDETYPYYCDSLLTKRSRYHYLLALAYELTGDEATAVQAYWQLWHDFPHSPYALMARAKLE